MLLDCIPSDCADALPLLGRITLHSLRMPAISVLIISLHVVCVTLGISVLKVTLLTTVQLLWLCYGSAPALRGLTMALLCGLAVANCGLFMSLLWLCPSSVVPLHMFY